MNYIVNDESDYTEEAYIINDIVKNVINEFDYSNILPTNDYIFFLVQYLEMVCNKYLKLINDDEEKNKKVKYEFRDYKYGKMYSETELRVLIYDKGFECIKCSDFKSYKDAVDNKFVSNVKSLEIILNINFKRGNGSNIKDHINEFRIKFKPYDIKFIRKSNFDDNHMLKIENDINEILKKIPAVNTIFCTKN